MPQARETSRPRTVWRLLPLLPAALLLWMFWKPGLAYPLDGWGQALSILLVGTLFFLFRLTRKGTGGFSVLPLSALALFVFWTLAVTTFSDIRYAGAGALTTLVMGLLFLAAGLLSADLAGSAQARRLGALSLLALAGFLALHGALQFHFFYPAQVERLREAGLVRPDDRVLEGVVYALESGRIASRLGNPNVFAGFLAMTFPLVLLFFRWARRHQYLWAQLLAGLLGLLLIYAIFRSRSVGGALTLLLGGSATAVLLWRLRKRELQAAALLLWALLAALTLPSRGVAETPRPLKTFEQRLYYWQTALSLWKSAPLTGLGAAGYAEHYGSARVAGAGETRYAHNFVLQMLAETGLVGLGLFGIFLVLLFRRVDWRQPWSAGLGLFLALFLFHSLGDYTFYARETFCAFCLAAGLSSREKARPEQRLKNTVYAAVLLTGALFIPLRALPDQMGRWHAQGVADLSGELPQSDPTRRARLWQQMLEWSNQALEAQPGHPRHLQGRARLYLQLGQVEPALRDLRQAAANHPFSASIRSDLAEALYRSGRIDAAMQRMDAAIALHPLSSGLYEKKARLLLEQGRQDAAREAARHALERAFTPLEQASAAKLGDSLGIRTHNP